MKCGRNDPCTCGSGIKYKKCCLARQPLVPPEGTNLASAKKHVFSLKGETGEAFVNDLAKKTFLIDWCYMNPLLPDGKELCDLLIVFGEVAIIWQIKNTKLTEVEQIKPSDYEKNLKQIKGAKRSLESLHTSLTLKNARGIDVVINTNEVREIYLISAFVGEVPVLHNGMESIKGSSIRIFTRSFIEIVLNELDTIGDFIEYMKKSETYLNSGSVIIDGGEEQLLGMYLRKNREFEALGDSNVCLIGNDFWDSLISDPKYIQKKKDDAISYFWDRMTDMVFETGSHEYELIGREFAKLIRFERRCLAQAFWDAYEKSGSTPYPCFRRTSGVPGTTYCFLFQRYRKGEDIQKYRIARKNHLEAYMFCARGEEQFIDNGKVIGIATDCGDTGMHSFDFGMFTKDQWTDEDRVRKEIIQSETGLFMEAKRQMFSAKEYRE